jgi:hypothetical protein
MLKDPTIVHTVANLRREAMLVEAMSAGRATPVSGRTTRSRTVIRGLVTCISAGISRLVDEFEPVPSPTDLTRGRLETRLRP